MLRASREDTLKTFRFQYPAEIPCRVNVSEEYWLSADRKELADLARHYPEFFPGFQGPPDLGKTTIPPYRRADAPWVDSWGCKWETERDGVTGVVTECPLPTWDALDDYTPPDPAEHNGWTPIDWREIAERIERNRDRGVLTLGLLRHGHTFLTLTYMRGIENLLIDMMEEPPQLARLIAMVEAFNAEHVRRYLALGVDIMCYPEDLGMQRGPMISPDLFRRHIKPVYRRLMTPAREAGALVHMHSDGDIMALADDLIDAGVQVLNIQDLVNGLDNMAERLKGRVAFDLDIDRQSVTVFGKPDEVKAHIRECVEKLGAPEGGLALKYACWPPTPLENLKAVMDGMRECAAAHRASARA